MSHVYTESISRSREASNLLDSVLLDIEETIANATGEERVGLILVYGHLLDASSSLRRARLTARKYRRETPDGIEVGA